VRDEKKAEHLKKLGADLVKFDFTSSPADMNAAFKTAAAEQVYCVVPFSDNFVPHIRAVVDACKANGIHFIVKLSAIGADAKSQLNVGKWHGECDDYLKASGIAYCLLKPNFFISNLYFQQNEIKTQNAFYGCAGTGRVAYLDPRDIAAVATQVLTVPGLHHNQTHCLTGPHAVSEAEVATILGRARGRDLKYVDVDEKSYRESFSKKGAPAWMIDAMAGLEGVKKAGWAASLTTAVKDITGHNPTSVETYCQQNAAAFT